MTPKQIGYDSQDVDKYLFDHANDETNIHTRRGKNLLVLYESAVLACTCTLNCFRK